MSKRLKRVYSTHDQVLHLWANSTQSDARCANVFFESNEVWSYGRHYKLGHILTINGQKIALINSNKYSVTTAKHQSSAYHAVEHMLRLWSSNVDSIDTALNETQEKLVDELSSFFNQRKFAVLYHTENVLKDVKDFNNICVALDREDMRLDVSQEYIEAMKDYVKLQIHKEGLRNSPEILAKKEAAKLKKLAETITLWRQGGQLVNELRTLSPQLLRVRGEVVETTRGAELPVSVARIALRRILQERIKEGQKIGPFQYMGMTGNIVRIGCHTFNVNEAKQVLMPQTEERTA